MTLKFQKSHHLVKENLIKSNLCNKTIYDERSTQPDFKVGDNVYLLNEVSKPGQKLSQINEDINKFETKNHVPIYQNSYVVYILLKIVKIFLFYIAYKFIIFFKNKYCKNHNHTHESSSITNCITFNMCKKKYSVATDSNNFALELESVIYDSDNVQPNENHKNSQLRRSSRLAKLKENIE